MGTWDYEPFDNDYAADLGDVAFYKRGNRELKEKYIKKFLLKMPVDSYGYHEFRGAVELARYSGLINQKLVKAAALNGLKKMLDDKDWIKSWNQPEKIKKSLRKQIRSVKNDARISTKNRKEIERFRSGWY